jgi:cyanophycinase
MPAPVPPGYTRGSIVWVGASSDATVAEGLRQWLWREAGGYGARLVLITVEAAQVDAVARLGEQLAALECDQLTEIVVLDRKAARAVAHVEAVEQATGIVLLGEEPSRWATILGGTPVAQAIRRANARSKLVAGIGGAGAYLCQHMISPGVQATTLRHMVAFGPGLGLVNRIVVDVTSTTPTHSEAARSRLLAAVAANPFLVGVGLAAGSAAILYPDNTLQAGGPNLVAVVDGQTVEAADLDASGDEVSSDEAVVGALHYTLHTGDGFNLDDHTLRPVGEIDLPPTGPVTSVF